MFDNSNKSKISFDKYVQMKSKLLVGSYNEKYKYVDKFLYIFSWFGNGVSIFLAFFFLQSLFYSSFNEISNSIFITLGIVFFLSLFELLKRYVFGMFSVELIRHKFKMFNKGMIVFITSTLLLIGCSFYFTLNGAGKFIDNQKTFVNTTKNVVNTKIDSINNSFDKQIQTYKIENENLRNINNALRTKLINTSDELTGVRNQYQRSIDKNDNIIENNQKIIDKFELDKKTNISNTKNEENLNLQNNLNENDNNIIRFLCISAIIELIIIIGVYYNKFYEYKTIDEYEKTIIETTNFKTWNLYNEMISIICSSSKGVGEKISTTDDLIDLLGISNIKISKPEFDRFIKLLYSLEILFLDGKRRILNKSEKESKELIKKHFKIK